MPDRLVLHNATLYSDEGEELTREQIEELSTYGFDYAKYYQLKKSRTISNITFYAGGALTLLGGIMIPNSNKPEYNLIPTAGVAIACIGILLRNKYDDQIYDLVQTMTDSYQLGFSLGGFSLTYSF